MLKIEQATIERVVVEYRLDRSGLDEAQAWAAENGYAPVRTGPKPGAARLGQMVAEKEVAGAAPVEVELETGELEIGEGE